MNQGIQIDKDLNKKILRNIYGISEGDEAMISGSIDRNKYNLTNIDAIDNTVAANLNAQNDKKKAILTNILDRITSLCQNNSAITYLSYDDNNQYSYRKFSQYRLVLQDNNDQESNIFKLHLLKHIRGLIALTIIILLAISIGLFVDSFSKDSAAYSVATSLTTVTIFIGSMYYAFSDFKGLDRIAERNKDLAKNYDAGKKRSEFLKLFLHKPLLYINNDDNQVKIKLNNNLINNTKTIQGLSKQQILSLFLNTDMNNLLILPDNDLFKNGANINNANGPDAQNFPPNKTINSVLESYVQVVTKAAMFYSLNQQLHYNLVIFDNNNGFSNFGKTKIEDFISTILKTILPDDPNYSNEMALFAKSITKNAMTRISRSLKDIITNEVSWSHSLGENKDLIKTAEGLISKLGQIGAPLLGVINDQQRAGFLNIARAANILLSKLSNEYNAASCCDKQKLYPVFANLRQEVTTKLNSRDDIQLPANPPPHNHH